LRRAAKSNDPEVSRRAERCLEQIRGDTDTSLVIAAIRLVALHKPAGAAEVLLGYLSSTSDEQVAREVRFALAEVAQRDGKPDPVVVKALEDKSAAVRSAAAAALGRDGGALTQQPGRRLLVPGLKVPMKITSYHDGKKDMEWRKTEMHLYNKFDDSVFAKPPSQNRR